MSIFLCALPATSQIQSNTQTDSLSKDSILIIQNTLADTLFIDTSKTIIYPPYHLSEKEKRQMEIAASNPGWYLLTQVAAVFNIGVYYSYLSPTRSFNQQVLPVSAFSFDIGLNLNRIIMRADANIYWYIGVQSDFTNFGKVTNDVKKISGDTTTSLTLKNSVEVYSFYTEAEYRKSFLCPFASIAYSLIYINPYKQTEIKIRNSTTNYATTSGDYLSNYLSKGVNISLGLKTKYRFNYHKELMLVTKISYLIGSETEMIDMSTASITANGDTKYNTIKVTPSWLLYTIGIKYNF